jgi:ABC-type oligopeptide transport system substrate-binding subunit
MKKVILSTLSVAVLGLGFTSIAEEEKTTEGVKQEATSIREREKAYKESNSSKLPFDPRNIKKAQEAYMNSSNRVDGQVKAMLLLLGGEEPDSVDQVR